MKPMYTAVVEVTGGRAGRARSSDGILDLQLTAPKEMGGPGTGTNPEQLFAAGYAACFESGLRFQGAARKTPIADCQIESTVSLVRREEGGFELAVKLHIVKLEGVDPETARELVDLVHGKICPYSNAIRGNVPVEIVLPEALS